MSMHETVIWWLGQQGAGGIAGLAGIGQGHGGVSAMVPLSYGLTVLSAAVSVDTVKSTEKITVCGAALCDYLRHKKTRLLREVAGFGAS